MPKKREKEMKGIVYRTQRTFDTDKEIESEAHGHSPRITERHARNVAMYRKALEDGNPNNPETFSAVYGFLARAKTDIKAGKYVEAGHLIRTATTVLGNARETKRAGKHYEHLSAQQISKIKSLYSVASRLYQELEQKTGNRDYERSVDSIYDVMEEMDEKMAEGAGRSSHSRRRLERLAAAAAIIGLIGALFFFSLSITGNAIGGETVSNSIGAAFFIMGLVSSFFWLNTKKK